MLFTCAAQGAPTVRYSLETADFERGWLFLIYGWFPLILEGAYCMELFKASAVPFLSSGFGVILYEFSVELINGFIHQG